jgi:hypothetical protein
VYLLQTRYGEELEGVDCYEGSIPPGRKLIVDSEAMEAFEFE